MRVCLLCLPALLWEGTALRRQSRSTAETSYGRRRKCSTDPSQHQLDTRTVADGEAGYDEARAQFGSNMGNASAGDKHTHPEMVAFCQGDADVVEVVNFAKECGFKVSVRSGGHNYAALSSCVAGTKCLQLDMSAFESFSQDGNTVTLGVGLSVSQVNDRLTPLGLVIPMGVCKDVNVGGHFQSSALGFLTRSFGSGMDHVKSFRIVTAEGKIQRVDRFSGDADLFWAVLGGGPGSWGVVLDYTIEAISAASAPHTHIIVKIFPYSHELFVNMGKKYLEIMSAPEVERDLEILFSVSALQNPMGPARGHFNHYINFQMLWTGLDNGKLTEELRAKWVQPIIQFHPGMPAPFPNVDRPMPLSHAAKTLTTPWDFRPWRHHISSMTSSTFLDNAFIEEVANELDARTQLATGKGIFTSFQFMPFGGTGKGSQLNRNKGMNAFPQRDIRVHIDDWMYFKSDENAQLAVSRMKGFQEKTRSKWRARGSAFRSWMTTGTIDADNASDARRFDGFFPDDSWLDRLRRIKGRVDAGDLFSSAMTIPPK